MSHRCDRDCICLDCSGYPVLTRSRSSVVTMDKHPISNVPFRPTQTADGRWEGTCWCGETFTGATADDVDLAQDEHLQNSPSFQD